MIRSGAGRHSGSATSGAGSKPGRAKPRAGTRVPRAAEGSSSSPSSLEPRRRPRQERARATVAAILGAAAEVIANEGYAAMTTNKVAARAGVSIGSLYQYFPNKQAILVSLLEEHLAHVHPVIERSLDELSDPGVPYAEAMHRMFVRLLALHRDADPRLQRALGEEVPQPPHVREQRRRREAGYVIRVAAILRERPDVRAYNPEMAAQVLVEATSALSRWLAHDAPPGLDREAYIREAVRLLTAHLQPSRR
jgi:AcrR family transcriptional regulator